MVLLNAVGLYPVTSTSVWLIGRPQLPRDQRTGLVNRNKTDGVHQICCHDLDDLVLHTVEVHREADGATRLELGIDS